MAEKKDGFFKRMFRFGKKGRELEKVEDETTSVAIGAEGEPAPVAHTDAAANVIADTEAGASLNDTAGITPIKDVPPPQADDEGAAERAKAEAEARRAEDEKKKRDADALAQREAGEAARNAEAEKAAEEAERLAAAKAEAAERERLAAEQAAADEAKRIANEQAAANRAASEEAERQAAEAEAAANAAMRAEEEAEKSTPKPDGVFQAPGETNVDAGRTDTPEPLSDTPEPPPPAAQPEEPARPEPSPAETTGDALSAPPKKSWFKRLGDGLARSSSQLTESISGVFTKRKLDDAALEDLEDILIRADLGVETATAITDRLADTRMGKDVTDEEVRTFMAEEIERVLDPVAAELELDLDHQPHVILVVGVNGSGKTTTIGKISQKLYDAGFSTLLVAGDTFRAAAIEQLKIWGERTLSPVIYRPHGADAAGLAYDAYEQAKEEGRDVVLMDTAGRLQNKTELMAELEKIIRVFRKLDPEAPHTVLLTLDATTGQNALSQVEIFKDVAGVNGLVMTKLDGTARGGILVSIAQKFALPVYFIGVGEQVEDLEPFEARDFARSIAGLPA